jgi:diguanylate cyclase (GGDEF)-like protein
VSQRILFVLPLVPVFIVTMVRFGRNERSIFSEIEFSALFVIVTIILIHITGLTESPLYPILYLTSAVLAIAVDTKVSVVAVFLLVISDVISINYFEEFGESTEFKREIFGRAFVSILFFVFFLLYGRVEFIKRMEIGRRLKRYEEDIKGVKGGVIKERRGGGISNESIEKEAIKTLANIDDTLFEFLDSAKSALSINGICYLIPDIDSEGFRIREGSSLEGEFDFNSVVDGEYFKAVIRTGKPLMFNDKMGNSKSKPGYYKNVVHGVSVLAVVPVVKGDASGVLVFDGNLRKGVSEGLLSLFQLVAFMVSEVEKLNVHLSRFATDIRELEELYNISRDLAKAQKEGDVLNVVFAAAKRMLPAKTMVFTSKRGDESIFLASWGEDVDRFKNGRFRNDDSLVGWVVENKKYLLYKGEEKRRNVFGEKYKIDKESALIIFPLTSEAELIGTFVLILRSKQIPTGFYVRIIELILNMTAVSMVRLRLMSRLNRLAITDPMTGLYNRRRFTQALKEHWEQAERYSEKMSLLMIDIDFFKKINDTYGHSVGDEVIKEVSAIILRTSRKVDIVSRIGGEEFAVLLPKIFKKSALATAERIRKAVKKDVMKVGKVKISVTISIGIASYPGDWSSVEALMKGADNALYEAKNEGRDRSVVI